MSPIESIGGPVIGVDFDNTIACYDDLIYRVAVERNLVGSDAPRDKTQIRQQVRSLEGGEILWQKLQATIYGPRMTEARPAAGVLSFFQSCRESVVSVFVVSHKTEFAGYDETGTNLRTAALSWMKEHRLLGDDGGLSLDRVHFETTRQDKIGRIGNLGCTHFIDDLEETFLEDSFPAGIYKLLYAPNGAGSAIPGVTHFKSWEEISRHLLASKARL